jgi:fatty-acyl-CoA synthase
VTQPIAGPQPGEATLDAVWQRLLADDPQALCLSAGALEWSRRDFEQAIQAQGAAWAAQGVGSGDVVAWLGLNTPQMLAALFACGRLGAVFLPLNWRLTDEELRQVLRHAKARCVTGTADMQDRVAHLDQTAELARTSQAHQGVQPGDLMLVYTSGTTGLPRGAVHTHAQVLANARAAAAVQGFGPHTRVLGLLPLFHVGGLCIQVMPALLAGGAVRLHARFDPGLWLQDVAAWRPQTSLLVPATMRAILEHPQWADTDLSSLQFINSGSSVVPLALIERFQQRGVPVAQVYGATETGPFSIATTPDQAASCPSLAGWPAPGVQVRLASADGADVPAGEVGEIQLRGPNVMRGYLGEPVGSGFVDGWFCTGDLARQRPDGAYEVVGRSKDMINSGGEKVFPAEIEALVESFPGVAECAVVGLPDAQWGEVPALALVPLRGQAVDLPGLQALFVQRLARYKHPRRIVIRQELPRTALGKVRKPQLAQELAESLAQG